MRNATLLFFDAGSIVCDLNPGETEIFIKDKPTTTTDYIDKECGILVFVKLYQTKIDCKEGECLLASTVGDILQHAMGDQGFS